MTILTTQKILEIHECVIERYGGTKGVLNIGTIDFLIYQLNKKNDVFEKAALALDNLCVKKPR